MEPTTILEAVAPFYHDAFRNINRVLLRYMSRIDIGMWRKVSKKIRETTPPLPKRVGGIDTIIGESPPCMLKYCINNGMVRKPYIIMADACYVDNAPVLSLLLDHYTFNGGELLNAALASPVHTFECLKLVANVNYVRESHLEDVWAHVGLLTNEKYDFIRMVWVKGLYNPTEARSLIVCAIRCDAVYPLASALRDYEIDADHSHFDLAIENGAAECALYITQRLYPGNCRYEGGLIVDQYWITMERSKYREVQKWLRARIRSDNLPDCKKMQVALYEAITRGDVNQATAIMEEYSQYIDRNSGHFFICYLEYGIDSRKTAQFFIDWNFAIDPGCLETVIENRFFETFKVLLDAFIPISLNAKGMLQSLRDGIHWKECECFLDDDCFSCNGDCEEYEAEFYEEAVRRGIINCE